MLRCTYRLTDKRTVVSQAQLNSLPHSGDRITLNNQAYTVDKVTQEGTSATIAIRAAS